MKRTQHNALQTTGAVKHAIGTGAAWLFVLIFTVIALLPFDPVWQPVFVSRAV